MPGVLQIEALAQAAGILAIETLELAGTGKLVYFMAIERGQVPQTGEPGVLLDLEANFVQKRSAGLQVLGQGLGRRQGDLRGQVHRDDRGR
jgi:3-hydroxyacyl-[acyl-carrier-protein] dehydratase